MKLTARQSILFGFVKKQHGDQKRKYTGSLYHFHLMSVAEIVSRYFDNESLAIEIALCHDLYEDTECSMLELDKCLIGAGYSRNESIEITVGVMHLTDEFTHEKYPHLNRGYRKILESKRLGKTDSMIQSIKYADLIDNTSSIVSHDPGFAKVYVEEKVMMLDRMRDGDIEMFILVCNCDVEFRHCKCPISHYSNAIYQLSVRDRK